MQIKNDDCVKVTAYRFNFSRSFCGLLQFCFFHELFLRNNFDVTKIYLHVPYTCILIIIMQESIVER